VSEVEPARRREFAEVKTQVLDDWREQRERQNSARYFATLLKKHDVVVDQSVKPLIGLLVGPIAGQVDPSGGEGIGR